MFECLHQNYHLQGFTTDNEFVYWSFTDSLVKTNLNNTVIAQVPVLGGHLGDIDYYGGKIYASLMGNALRGEPWGQWTSFHIDVFDCDTLALEKMIRLDPCYKMHANIPENHGFRGIDGVAVKSGADGRPELWVAAALETAPEYDKQMLMHFNLDGELIEIKYFKTGNTTFGIQNLDYEDDTGLFWFTTYGGHKEFQTNTGLFSVRAETEEVISEHDIMIPYGFHAYGKGKYLVSFQTGRNGNRQGYAYDATIDEIKRGAIYKHHFIP